MWSHLETQTTIIIKAEASGHIKLSVHSVLLVGETGVYSLFVSLKSLPCAEHIPAVRAGIGEWVGEVFALNMIPHIAHWPPPELLTDGAVVAPVLGLPHNVLAKIILTSNKPWNSDRWTLAGLASIKQFIWREFSLHWSYMSDTLWQSTKFSLLHLALWFMRAFLVPRVARQRSHVWVNVWGKCLLSMWHLRAVVDLCRNWPHRPHV